MSNHPVKELTVTGTTASTVSDCRRAARMLGELGDLGWMVTDVLDLDRAMTAIERIRTSAGLEVVLKPRGKQLEPLERPSSGAVKIIGRSTVFPCRLVDTACVSSMTAGRPRGMQR